MIQIQDLKVIRSKLKNRCIYYFYVPTHRFSEGLDLALEDLVWIYLQNILEQVRIKTNSQIHSYIYIDQHLSVIASFNNQNENYFKSLLCEKLNAEDDLTPPECLNQSKQYLERTAELYLQPEKQNISYKKYSYSSLKYQLAGNNSFVQIEDYLNITYNSGRFINYLNQQKIIEKSFSNSVLQ